MIRGQKSESLQPREHNNLRYFSLASSTVESTQIPNIGYSKTSKQNGVRTSNLGHLTGRVNNCWYCRSKNICYSISSFDLSVVSPHHWHSFDIAVENLPRISKSSLLATEFRWLTDESKPQRSEKCQMRGIIRVSFSVMYWLLSSSTVLFLKHVFHPSLQVISEVIFESHVWPRIFNLSKWVLCVLSLSFTDIFW